MTLPEVYVAVGSNIEAEKNLARAVRLLRAMCRVEALSAVYRSAPQGYSDQPDFLNTAVKLRTPLAPAAFKTDVLEVIEQRLERRRDPNNKNAPRTIDLDIMLWGDAILEYGIKPWRVPDGDIVRYAHVALPLAELAPDFVHPEARQTLAQIAARFDTRGLQRLDLTLEK